MSIRDIIYNFIKEYLRKERLYSELCTVTSVDETKRTAEVKPVSGATLYNVRLQAIPSQTVGFVPIPKVASFVIVTFMDNRTGFISTYTECTKILIDTDLVQFNGGTLDGMVKVNDLVTKLNNIENDLNDLKTAFSTWVTVPQDGGAALKAITATWFGATFTPTVKNDLEDATILH